MHSADPGDPMGVGCVNCMISSRLRFQSIGDTGGEEIHTAGRHIRGVATAGSGLIVLEFRPQRREEDMKKHGRHRSKMPICHCCPESIASSPRMHVEQNRRSQVRVDRQAWEGAVLCLVRRFRAKWFAGGCSRLDDLSIPFLMALLVSLSCVRYRQRGGMQQRRMYTLIPNGWSSANCMSATPPHTELERDTSRSHLSEP